MNFRQLMKPKQPQTMPLDPPLPTQKYDDKYNHDWITEYSSQNIDELRNRDFFGSTVIASQQDLIMPYDFPKLLCFLTPMVKGNPIDEFSIEEFMECMSINNGKVINGRIECLTLTGPAKGVVKFILGLNLSEVSDVAFLMAGKITNRDAKETENAIRSAGSVKKFVSLVKNGSFLVRI